MQRLCFICLRFGLNWMKPIERQRRETHLSLDIETLIGRENYKALIGEGLAHFV